MADVQKTIEYVVSVNDEATASFGKIAAVATAAGAAILAGLSVTVEMAREQARADKLLDAVLKSTRGAAGLTADEIKEMSEAFQSATNFGDDAILAAQNVLLTYTGIGRETFPRATQAVLDMSAALGLNLTSAAERVGNILNYPSEAINSLTRQGFRFTEQQQEQIRTMEAAGDIAGAQAVIFQELELAYGGAAAALAEPTKQLTNDLGELGELVGAPLADAIDAIAVSLRPVVQSVVEWAEKNPELVESLVLITAAIGTLLTVGGALSLAIGGINLAFGALGVTLAVGGPIALALLGIVSLIVVVTQHWEGLKWMIGNFVTATIEWITGWIATIRTLFDAAWVAIQFAFSTGIAWVSDQWNSFLEGLKNAVMAPIDAIRGAFEGVFSWIANTIGAVMEKIGAAVNAVRNVIPGQATARTRGRATGGYAQEALTLVGENGPELISAPGSRVHNAQQTREMLGSKVEVHVHVSGGMIGVSSREIVSQLGDMIMRQLNLTTNHA